MKYLLISILVLFAAHSIAQDKDVSVRYSQSRKQIKPALFADLGPSCSTPDGMAIDRKGRLFLAVTNLASFETYGSKILIFDADNKPTTWFDQLPLHPISKKVHPMGIEFGSDGHLYIADNQSFAGQLNQSRILRILVKNGKATKVEVLVEGLNFSNGIRWSKDRLFITDFIFDDQQASGIYAFPLAEMNQKTISLNTENKPKYLISTFAPGIDGLAFDKHGALYVGNFYTGTITKFEFDQSGAVSTKKVIIDDEQFNCADGMYYHEESNSIFLANLSNNSVHQLDLNTNILHLIWVNGNTDGSDGLLDNPGETIIYKGNIIIVNFDTFEGVKNLEVDPINTVSNIKLY